VDGDKSPLRRASPPACPGVLLVEAAALRCFMFHARQGAAASATGRADRCDNPNLMLGTARCRHAWNKLVDQPWSIMSIGARDWAYRS